MRPELDEWALDGAEWMSRRSKDPSHKVGAIVLRPDGTLAGGGYNGFPKHVCDDPALYADKAKKRRRIQHAERNAINAPIQGSAADMIKLAMIRIQKAIDAGGYQTKLLLQVHDELIFDVPIEEKQIMQTLVKSEMEQALPLKIPVEVGLGWGSNWLEAH